MKQRTNDKRLNTGGPPMMLASVFNTVLLFSHSRFVHSRRCTVILMIVSLAVGFKRLNIVLFLAFQIPQQVAIVSMSRVVLISGLILLLVQIVQADTDDPGLPYTPRATLKGLQMSIAKLQSHKGC